MLVPILFLSCLSAVTGQSVPAVVGTLDLPSGWQAGPTPGVYQDRSGEMTLTTWRRSPEAGRDPRSLFEADRSALKAEGEGAGFEYSGLPAFIGDITFPTNAGRARGYLITVASSAGAVTLLGYSIESSYDRNYPELLSALDSFALPNDERLPGPISQFLYPLTSAKPLSTVLDVNGSHHPVITDVREMETAQTVIDRETEVLAENKTVNAAAWRRFYRMVFRDNYHRVDPYLETLSQALHLTGKSHREISEALLQWIQRFLYARTGTFADLSNPLLTLLTQTGDCDSRTLLYALLLEHLGVPAILMVSSQYGHSMVGVDIPGSGARFSFGGRSYVVAEVTAEVPIGRIDSTMADPRGWLGVDLSRGQSPASD